jgi:preprotein translocase subunit YajC
MGGAGFLLIILAFVFLYFVVIRPQKRRQLQSQRMLNELQVGDEVVTAGGLYGEIRELREDDVLVEIAPGLEVRIARRAIGGVVPSGNELDEDEPDEDEPEDDEPEDGVPQEHELEEGERAPTPENGG